MEEGRIVDPQPGADHGVVLVASRADRVEAAVRLLELARGDIQLARGELVLEEGERAGRGQPASVPQRGIGGKPVRCRLCALEVRVELSLDGRDAVPGHAAIS